MLESAARHPRLRVAFITIALAGAAAYFLLPEPASAFAYLLVSTLALVAVPLGVAVHRPSAVRPWLALAAAQAAFLVADLVWYVEYMLSGSEPPFPSGVDLIYLAGYPLLALGMMMFIRARQPRYRLIAAIDAVIIGLGGVLLLWVTVMDGVIHDEAVPLAERAIVVAYPFGDALILAAAVYLILTGRHGRSALYPFVASLVALLAADVTYATITDKAIAWPLSDALWMASYTLFGLAALSPAMGELSMPSEAPAAPESNRRLVVLGGAIVVLPLFALYQRFVLGHVDFALIGIVGAVTIGAVLLRMRELGAVLGRSERRYASLLANASDAFAVIRPDGVFTYVSPASEHVLGYDVGTTIGRSAYDLVSRRFRARALATMRRVGSAPGMRQEIELPVRRADGQWRWLSIVVTNRTDDPIVNGIVLNYRDITERKQLEHRLEQQAFTDALTGLANRALFGDRVEHLLQRRRRAGASTPVAVLFLDVDDFKAVNDSLGHSAGDRLLQTLAERLRTTVRPSDTVARLGGDEFAVLLENAAEADAAGVAARLLDSLAVPVEISGIDVRISVSVGIAVAAPGVGISVEQLLLEADLAMYSAKSAQPGSYALFEPEMQAAAIRRLEGRAAPAEVAAAAKVGAAADVLSDSPAEGRLISQAQPAR